MKRKVIQIANSTQLVSLPRKWCLEHGVKKGDELEVEENGNKIQVSTSKEETLETAKIHFANADSFLKRPLMTLYKLGYDQVDVEFDDPSIIPLIQEEINQLMGFEIVSHTERTCTVRNVASALDTEFDSILRRIMLMLTTMAKDTSDALSKHNFNMLGEIIKRERLNNKLTLFCERILNKKGYKDHKRLTFIYYIVCQTEHVADDLRDICVYCAEHNPKLRPAMVKLLKDTSTLVDHIYNLFYKFNIEGLNAFKKQHASVEKHATALLRTGSRDEIALANNVLKITDKMHHMSTYCIT